ncbi:Tetratricopeptide repeat-containing protein [Amycolatopsis xylanica]|uniref:Tetratricopeptide repeat-containing protein n=1 Tax=Amycolatopsis xylanica TaxID=589385 RepID=A0A1H3QPW1_9PSEU|nr:tetratricopeptide repeat protein [Amycolatopsis xylanica]SDZ15622.1 Tetratricopeptide repeat-containing protein [Amycolatopsis xylanica]
MDVVDSRPWPEAARTPADFVGLLRRMRDRSGLSMRLIERRAAALGHSLPPSTLATMLGRDSLPRERLITALLRACGEDQAAVARWIEVRRRLAGGGTVTPPMAGALRQLPMDIEEFTGREAELAELGRLSREGTAVGVTVITGMAGVGKTRLAVRAAHLLVRAGTFDEIQLWADLRLDSPLDPGVVLETFLHTLGLPAEQIPLGLESRAVIFRDRLAGRRALVLLDNVADETQVLPLLPGSTTNHVLVTSRNTLTGLDGARYVDLDVFTPEESVALMARIAGRHRTDADPEAARRIAELCGHLPLAVSLAARRLATRPAWSLPAFANRLADNRLARLGSSHRSVSGVFALSYQALPSAAQRMFRLLGSHMADDIDVRAAAALAGVAALEADQMLERLLDEHLLIQATPGRYRMHDLVRLFARSKASESADALVRLLEHYQAGAEQATKLLHPTESRRLPASPSPGTCPIATVADATTWLEAEHRNLLGLAARAPDLPKQALPPLICAVTVLYRPLTNLGLSSTHIRLTEFALAAARRIPDRRAEAMLLEDLGTIHSQHGGLSEAIEHNTAALAIWCELGDRTGEAGCLTGLGIAYYQQGRFAEAAETLKAALVPSRESGYAIGEASVLNYLGLVCQGMADFEEAIRWHSKSMDRYEKAGSRHGWAFAVANTGWAYQRSGRPAEAIPCHERSLAVFATVSDRYNEAEQHWGLGQAFHALGDGKAAREQWDRAITMLRDASLIEPAEAAALLGQAVPDTPEIVRLNS